MKANAIWFAVFLTAISCGELLADTFGSGANSFDIEFVTIGNPGNPADHILFHPSLGRVDYIYRMSKYEVSWQMVRNANTAGDLGLILSDQQFLGDRSSGPARALYWVEAARFVNWLNTSTGNPPAYKFQFQVGDPNYSAYQFCELWTHWEPEYQADNRFRSKLAKYFLPNDNEWYKAAYYDPVAGHYWEYPTGSNTPPDGIDFAGDRQFDLVFDEGGHSARPNDITDVGLLSPYGTAGQGGNVWEYFDTPFNEFSYSGRSAHRIRGGDWAGDASSLSTHTSISTNEGYVSFVRIGFRIASVPEPTSLALISLTTVMLGAGRYRTRRS